MLVYLVLFALFYILTPGIFLSLPSRGSKQMVALTHAIVFVGAFYFAEMLFHITREGFQMPMLRTKRPEEAEAARIAEEAAARLERAKMQEIKAKAVEEANAKAAAAAEAALRAREAAEAAKAAAAKAAAAAAKANANAKANKKSGAWL